MNGRAIPGAEMNTFRLTNVIPERIIFVSRGITVLHYGVHHLQPHFLKMRSINNSCSVVTNYKFNIQLQSASSPTVMLYWHGNMAQWPQGYRTNSSKCSKDDSERCFLFTISYTLYRKHLKACANNYDATNFHKVPLLCATTGHLQTLQTTANQQHVTEIRKEGFEDTCWQKGVLCVISGFCCKVAEFLLVYDEASSGTELPLLAVSQLCRVQFSCWQKHYKKTKLRAFILRL